MKFMNDDDYVPCKVCGNLMVDKDENIAEENGSSWIHCKCGHAQEVSR